VGGARHAETLELGSVPGFVVFDLPGAPFSAGGTRLAPDVTKAEVALLARAMTYKFAVLGERIGGAKAGVVGDPADRVGRASRMARYCAEIRPLVDSGRFLTGPDMGTSEQDFAPLREGKAPPTAIGAIVDGLPFEDVLTGFGGVTGGRAGRSPSRGSARWAAAWPVRSLNVAVAWLPSPPSRDASRAHQGSTLSDCSRCAAFTPMSASPTMAAGSARQVSSLLRWTPTSLSPGPARA